MVADLLRLVRQVIRVNADAVTTHQARPERQEIPLGAGSLQHLGGVDAQAIEDQREFVHQRDVEVALGVLDHLGRLGDADAAGAVGARDGGVKGVHVGRRLGHGPGGDLGHRLQAVLAVAGVDALRAVADEEITVQRETRLALQHRRADLFGGAGVYGGLVDHHVTALEHAAQRAACSQQRRKIGPLMFVDRGRHGDNVGVPIDKIGKIAGQAQPARSECLAAHLAGGVMATAERSDALRVDVKA